MNFEIFESSSEEELSQGAFESAAESFQNKENRTEEKLEEKQREREKRQQRKRNEKIKKRKEEEKVKRKEHRRWQKGKDEFGEDLLTFKDSDQESVVSYFEKASKSFVIDTPTRLVNESNEFIPKQVAPHQR